MPDRIPFRISGAILLIAHFIFCSVTFGGDTKPASYDTETIAAIESLEHWIANNPLELSTADSSSSKQFCFEFRIAYQPGSDVPPLRILILRDDNRVAMLVRSLDGKCYTYFTDGLMITLDHDHPGGFVMSTVGVPTGDYWLDAQGRIHFDWTYYRPHGDGHRIMVSLHDDLKSLLDLVTKASYDRQSKSYVLKTKQSSAKLTIDPSAAIAVEFFLKEYVGNWAGLTLAFKFIDAKEIPARFHGLIADVAVTKNALTNSGLPIRDVSKESNSAFTTAVDEAFVVPKDFASDPEDLKATSKLSEILAVPADTTQPSEGR